MPITPTEVSDLQPVRGPGPLAVAGALVGVATPAGVEVHDLTTHAIRPLPGGPELQLASDGDALVVVSTDRGAKQTTVTRTTAGAPPATTKAPMITPVASCLVAHGKDLFVVEPKAVSKLAGSALELGGFHAATRTIDGCARAGDGLAYIAGGTELVALDRALAATRSQPGVGTLRHVASGGSGRVWVTSDTGAHLLELTGKVVHSRPLAGIYHAAGAGGGLAVLTVTMTAGAWATLTLQLVGDDGTVRWSKPLPLPGKPAGTAVAASAAHVAVVVDGALHVFATATGAPERP